MAGPSTSTFVSPSDPSEHTEDTYDDGDLSDSELFEQLEEEMDDNGPFMTNYREQRLAHLKQE